MEEKEGEEKGGEEIGYAINTLHPHSLSSAQDLIRNSHGVLS